MKLPEKLGVVFTIAFVTPIVLSLNGFNLPMEIKQSILGIPFAVVVALVVWYGTTKRDRDNRKYTRTKVANIYLQSLAIVQGLIYVPRNRTNTNGFLDQIRTNYEDIEKRAEVHSHLLDASEIDQFTKEHLVINDLFDPVLRSSPNDTQTLRELFDFLLNNLSTYVLTHKLKEFNEYVIR